MDVIILCVLIALLFGGGLSTLYLTGIAVKVVIALLFVAVIVALVRVINGRG